VSRWKTSSGKTLGGENRPNTVYCVLHATSQYASVAKVL
jgi:hypothetical protein